MMGAADGVYISGHTARLFLALYFLFAFIMMCCSSSFRSLCHFHLSLYPVFLSFVVDSRDVHPIGHSPDVSASL